MIVLGISPLDKDATVSLLIDGRVAWAVAEERLSRKKMHAGFPHLALELVLAMSGVRPAEIDCVAYAFAGWEQEAKMMRRNRTNDWRLNRASRRDRLSTRIRQAQASIPRRNFAVHGLASAMEKMSKSRLKQLWYEFATQDGLIGDLVNHWQLRRWINVATADHRKYHGELLAGLRQFGLEEKLVRVEHHQSHVANAFYPSGFDQALVATIDAYGSGLSGTISVVDDSGIRRLSSLDTPYSLGTFYEYVTSALGMSPDRHAGKVVGLAAYGDPKVLSDVLRSLFVWKDGTFRMRRSSDVYLARRLSTMFPKIDLAAAYQTVLEEVVVRYIQHYVDKTGIDTVVLSGGVTANVKMNQRIHEIPGVYRVYVHPNMGDGGCGTGAAILQSLVNGETCGLLGDVYLGPEYSDTEIEQALDQADLPYQRLTDIEPQIAQLVAKNRVVARFNGRMEYGPRALGNRSILYQATDPAVNQWLNTRLGRTEFMPFAPATLFEDREQCYKRIAGAEFAAQFMTVTFDCTPWMIEHSPAAVHVDGTARPQLVTSESNPSFHRVLTEYKRLTGLPSLINTSFNMHEEPIVCTPQDAVRAFVKGRLDYLAIGNYLVASPEFRDRDSSVRRRATSTR
jgi:carbamoyltransferase